MKRLFFAAASLLLMLNVTAQTPWLQEGNSTTNPTLDYVGTDDNEELVFRTDDLFRFRLNKTETYGTLGGFTSVPANGFALISPSDNFINNAPGPYSLLHIADADNNAQQASYRDWMHVGLTFTGNRDHGYIGQKHGEEFDFTDMVVHWSDNPTKWLKDRMRFIFTSGYNDQVATGANSLEGLEAMRLYPVDNDNVNIGLGDFYAGNIADPSNVLEPTERLDVLSGKVRIRELPTDAVSTSNEYVTVNTTTGVLEHRPLPPASIANCEWSRNTTNKHVLSGVGNPGSGGSCPDREWLYNIGDPSFPTLLNGKMTVYQNNNERALRSGLHMKMITLPSSPSECYGILSEVTPVSGQSTPVSYGVRASVKDPCNGSTGGSGYGYGTAGIVTKSNTSAVAEMYGASGDAQVVSAGVANRMIGTHGRSYVNQGTATESIGVFGRSILFMASGSVLDSRGGSFLSQAYTSTATNSYGLSAMSESRNGGAITGKSIGVKAESRAILGGTVNDSHGVWATGDHASNENYGVYCKAGGSGIRNFSLRAGDPGSGSQDWSGYFDGRVTIVSDLYHNTTLHFSDASLKTNVEDITGVRERLEGLRPRSYNFTDDAQMRMGSSTGLQFGLIAQEVEGVIPELVSGTTIASVVDTAGSVVWPDHEVKAVNYIGIIPLLVAGYQEQQRTIDALQEQLGQMQQTLAACCANPDGSRLQAPTNTTEPTLDGRGDDRKLRIVPNPFNESTTVYYTLERAGRTQLMANSADGRELRVLQEADLTTGDYEFQWNTAGLAPGMYYVTLLLDGQPVVKKAVKVDR